MFKISWDSVIEKVVVGIVTVAITGLAGWIYSYITSDPEQPIRATANYIVFEPFLQPETGEKKIGDIARLLLDDFQIENPDNNLRYIMASPFSQAGVIGLKNDGKKISKPIIITLPRGLLLSKKATKPTTTIDGRIEIRPLGPGEGAIVFVFNRLGSELNILHDDRRVEFQIANLAWDSIELWLALHNVELSAFALIGILTCLFILYKALLIAFRYVRVKTDSGVTSAGKSIDGETNSAADKSSTGANPTDNRL